MAAAGPAGPSTAAAPAPRCPSRTWSPSASPVAPALHHATFNQHGSHGLTLMKLMSMESMECMGLKECMDSMPKPAPGISRQYLTRISPLTDTSPAASGHIKCMPTRQHCFQHLMWRKLSSRSGPLGLGPRATLSSPHPGMPSEEHPLQATQLFGKSSSRI